MPARPRARKRYGQHFLQTAWADKLVAAIDPQPADRFVEIGPGPGALTLRLAPRVAQLVAVEVDPDLVATLRGTAPANVTLVQGDFLRFDLGPLTRDNPIRVVGNLPYNISSPILFKLVRDHRKSGGLRDATLMLQREVAERIEAVPGTGEYGVLSILIGLHADVRRVLTLPPGAFRPAPKVHSAVIRLDFREPRVPLRDETAFEQMVRSIFTQRRKTLLNALRPFAHARGADPRRALESATIDSTRRPETLDLQELARLADALASRPDQGPDDPRPVD
jgi:16S rRNA (adenine1518-N6/adenine1519-N6)-dimethyltransferase